MDDKIDDLLFNIRLEYNMDDKIDDLLFNIRLE